MFNRHESEIQLLSEYCSLQQRNPNPSSQEKVDFYQQNSKFIICNSKNPQPEIAIIIPAYNEEKLIAGTLASINAASKDQPNAVTIVVDNNSDDETAQIAEEFGAIVVRESKKGIGYARQAGLEAVPDSTKYILTTDADTFVPRHWIESHYNLLSQNSVVCTHGGFKYFVESTVSLTDKLVFNLYQDTVHIVRAIKRKPDPIKIGGSNTGFRLDVATLCGGYNRSLTHGEDLDIIRKLSLMGDVVRVNSDVLTSARRVIGKGIVNSFMLGVRHNLASTFGIKEPNKKPFVNEFKDYR